MMGHAGTSYLKALLSIAVFILIDLNYMHEYNNVKQCRFREEK